MRSRGPAEASSGIRKSGDHISGDVNEMTADRERSRKLASGPAGSSCAASGELATAWMAAAARGRGSSSIHDIDAGLVMFFLEIKGCDPERSLSFRHPKGTTRGNGGQE